MAQRAPFGFTLAELLISLLILGEIATFTIPKILSAQQDKRNNAIAKEAIATMSTAFQQYVLQNGLNSNVTANNLIQYVNYVGTDSSTLLDNSQGYGTFTCSSSNRCLTLHNGAKLVYHDTEYFAGTGATNGIWFLVDPDGSANNSASMVFYILYSGRVAGSGDLPAISSSVGTYGLAPNPSWFSW